VLFVMRILGGWAILAATIALVSDLTTSGQTGAKLAFSSLGKDWYAVSPSSLDMLQASIERHVARVFWDPVFLTLLKVPAFAVFGVLGIGLYFFGLRRRRVNIYAN